MQKPHESNSGRDSGDSKMKDTRPVRCYICKRKMYYVGHPKYEPEYILNDITHNFKGYVHKRCVELKKSK